MLTLTPPNEFERLAALQRLSILDAPVSPFLDRICRVAQQIFNVPISAVTFLDATQQFFKAHVGLDGITGTARSDSFCQYTIMHDEVFVISDARADRAFAANPYVTGDPHICFYAGVPLTTEPGIRLGSLCVIDTRPREFSLEETAILAGLGRLVVDELWLHHLEQAGRAQTALDPAPKLRVQPCCAPREFSGPRRPGATQPVGSGAVGSLRRFRHDDQTHRGQWKRYRSPLECRCHQARPGRAGDRLHRLGPWKGRGEHRP